MNLENYSYDPKRRLWIPFKTPKDTLIASLYLSQKVPTEILDQVLNVIKHSSFACIASKLHRDFDYYFDTSDLSFRSSKEIIESAYSSDRERDELNAYFPSVPSLNPDLFSYDLRSMLWVQFRTPKDAQFASLVYSEKIPPEIMDQLLNIIWHPSFDYIATSVNNKYHYIEDDDELTLENLDEVVDTAIATDMKRLEFNARYPESTTVGIPNLVLYLVVEFIIQNMELLLLDIENVEVNLLENRATSIFESMMYVHPTWIPYVERGFHRRRIFNRERTCMCSSRKARPTRTKIPPSHSQMIRELAVLDKSSYATDLLPQVPNLKHFMLRDCDGRKKHLFLKQLKKNVSLENLTVIIALRPKIVIGLEEAISCLTGLKSCFIQFENTPGSYSLKDKPTYVPKGNPPQSLKSLVFTITTTKSDDGVDTYPPICYEVFKWYTHPRNGYSLESLAVSSHNLFLSKDFQYLSVLNTLEIHLLHELYMVDDINELQISKFLNLNIFPRAKNLRCLYIVPQMDSIEKYSLDLSPLTSLKTLEIELYLGPGRKLQKDDEEINRIDSILLQYVNPLLRQELKKFRVSIKYYEPGEDKIFPYPSLETAKACREHGVDFIIRETSVWRGKQDYYIHEIC